MALAHQGGASGRNVALGGPDTVHLSCFFVPQWPLPRHPVIDGLGLGLGLGLGNKHPLISK